MRVRSWYAVPGGTAMILSVVKLTAMSVIGVTGFHVSLVSVSRFKRVIWVFLLKPKSKAKRLAYYKERKDWLPDKEWANIASTP